MNTVFVYGSLLKGEENAHLLEGAICIEDNCWTNGLLYDTGFGYPAMIPSLEHRTYGELYIVTDHEMKHLDDLEDYVEDGTNNLYNRVKQEIFTNSKSTYAYVYIANQDDLLVEGIHHGDWRKYKSSLCV